MLMQLIAEFYEYIILANIFLTLILVISNLLNKRKIKKLTQKYNKFMTGLSDKNIEEVLEICLEDVQEIKKSNKEFKKAINDIDNSLVQCIQKVGIIRYTAFDNVGSDLSFAIALMDANNNGVVLNGIYSRDGSSTYAKILENGQSKHKLSAEEIQAIEKAKKSYSEGFYYNKEKIQ